MFQEKPGVVGFLTWQFNLTITLTPNLATLVFIQFKVQSSKIKVEVN